MLRKQCSGRFLNYYRDENGYEFVSRKPEQTFVEGNHTPDAVVIIAIEQRPKNPTKHTARIVLVRENRPPTGGKVLSFPAGLIDNGELPIQAAVREFKEETGLDLLKPTLIKETAFTSPGMSDEINSIVLGWFDGSQPSKAEEGSTVILLPMDKLADALANNNVSAKLATFITPFLLITMIDDLR